jgi:hypothetical protein
MILAWMLALGFAQASSVTVKKPVVDPFCIAPAKREELKAKLKEKIDQSDCAWSLRKLHLARLDCSQPQTIRDFKSAMLGAVRPDDAYVEGFARAVCPGKADAACMNPEPQCRSRKVRLEPRLDLVAGREKREALLRKYYLDRLPDISENQAQVMVDHYLENLGKN